MKIGFVSSLRMLLSTIASLAGFTPSVRSVRLGSLGFWALLSSSARCGSGARDRPGALLGYHLVWIPAWLSL